MKRTFGIALVLILAMGLASSQLFAQDYAAVTGVVTDTNGAVVAGASVTLVNTTTNVTYHGTTGSIGSYLILNVTPGPGYKITFTRTGFEPLSVKDIALNVATTRTQNAKLHAGDVSQTIEVSAANDEATIDTTDATVGNNLDVKLLNNLPVQNRDNPSVLFTLQPGVGFGGAITGARTDQSEVTVDGLDVDDIATGQTFLMISEAPVDSIEEFRGTVAGQLASGGPGGGGQFQLVTRGGTNSFHGDLNEYHRDVSTVANDWFSNDVGVPRAPYIRNQFGGQIGGPALKDKLFFLFNLYDSRIIRSTDVNATVPSDGYRNGSISYILAAPSSGTSVCSFTSRENTTPLCVGTLTPAQVTSFDPKGIGFSSVIQSFLASRYPHANDPTGGDGLNTLGFRFTAPVPDFETNYVARVDYTLSSTMKLFARATISREDGTSIPLHFPTDPVSNPEIDRSYSYVLGHNWVIGANMTNAFLFGNTITKFSFPATYDPSGTTALTFGGGTSFFLGDPYNSQESQKRRVPIPVVRDDFNWQKGSHTLSFGGSFKFVKTESQQVNDFNFVSLGLGGELGGLSSAQRPSGAPGGPAAIRGGSTAPALYDNAFAFALGRIASIGTNYNYTNAGAALPQGTGSNRSYRYYESEFYASDSWKVNAKLTLSYGLRYQYYSVPYETHGDESILNMGFDKYFAARVAQSKAGISGDSSVPFLTYNLGGKANNAAPLYSPSYKDFAPRFSFAYTPSTQHKLVINGGAGIVYDRTIINALNFIQDQSSYLFQNTVNTPFGSGSALSSLTGDPRIGTNFAFPTVNAAPPITKPFTPNVSGGTPFGLPAFAFNSVVDPNLKDPYSIAMNLGFQDQLPGNFVLKVSYVGRLGRRLIAQVDASQLLDFPDNASGQLMSTAFGNMTKQVRAGGDTANLTAQPWFEHVVPPGVGVANGYPNNTSLVADNTIPYVANGDFADFIQEIASFGLLDTNVGMASQFSENTFYTNKGFSSYNGLLTTLSKNLSHGLQFDLNYTYSHSIDNTSQVANSIASGDGVGFICEAQYPRACRGNSDFDEKMVINSNFVYDLPFGKGKTFGSGASRLLDEAIGGWSITGIPAWHSGVAFTAFANAFVAGFANNAPAIFDGDHSALHAHRHKKSDGSVNLYDNPTAANAAFSGPVGFTIGSRNNLRGPTVFTMDAGLAKNFPIVSDKVSMKFRADAFNVFNHPTFAIPNSDITDTTGPFGQINSQTGSPRVLQLALRLEF